ncbi:hypothetical protein [Paraburkholderia sp. SIMBA_054]|uniref:hypothetical protein n=1 Tax=Paraburkholderia sp. SIMBA_054 TaxID=3085795 RepID=UPI00397C9A03
MSVKAWWNEEKRYPSGETFSRGENVLYASALVVVLLLLVAIFLTAVPWLTVTAYEGLKADLLNPRPLAEISQRNEDLIYAVVMWAVPVGATLLLIIRLVKEVRKSALRRWMDRNCAAQ